MGHGWFGHAEDMIDYGFRVDFNGRSIPSILPPCERLENAEGVFGQNMSWLSWKDFINLEDNPTYVVLDLGCTRSMGSMNSVKAFIDAGKKHGITAKWRRVKTLMSFANSQSTVLECCVDFTFPTNPPVTTSVDVNPSGNVPILMSLSQMQNLEFDLKLKPEGYYLTCAQLGATNE